MNNNNEVLIVGAGPTGMLLALLLERYNVSFRIIDKRISSASGSKALTINPLSLIILNNLGLDKSVIRKGHETNKLNIYLDNKKIFNVNMSRLDSASPYYLMLPQPETEQVLCDALIDNDYEIEYGTCLNDLVGNDEYVSVETVDKNKITSIDNYKYVVGCDGSHSVTRRILNHDFIGHDYDMHFVLADLKIKWNKPLDQGHYFTTEKGFIIILPLGGGYHRIVANKHGKHVSESCPDIDTFKYLIDEYNIADLTISDLIWSSSSPFYNRLAEKYASNRVYLAGDACHSFSPLGGFGMNTGFGDVFNLAWKLYYCLKSVSKHDILDSYETERRMIALRLIQQTDLSTSLIARLDRHSIDDELKWLPLMSNRKHIQNTMYSGSGLSQHYNKANELIFKNELKVNCLLPFIHDINTLSETGGAFSGKHSSIFFLTKEVLYTDILGKITSLFKSYRRYMQLIIITDFVTDNIDADIQVIVDESRSIETKYNVTNGSTILLRPDLYVEYLTLGHHCLDSLSNYINKKYDFSNVNNKSMVHSEYEYS